MSEAPGPPLAGRRLAAVRAAVRRDLAALADPAYLPDQADQADQADQPPPLRPGALVLVACSGGPDSLALAAATGFVAPRLGLRAGAIVVDHGLQPGSAAIAEAAARDCRACGLHPVVVTAVEVRPGPDGPEAVARTARYAALDEAARDTGAVAVLLGHTADDQAEQVLLGLLRGSGTRSLSGMPARRGIYRRPLLQLRREATAGACAEAGLQPWHDPQNEDPGYARARVRALLRQLGEQVGPGVVAGLARSADLLRADADALDAAAGLAWAALSGAAQDERGLDCRELAALAPAVRTRVLRLAALAAGARSADLSSVHLRAVDALVADWHGQGPVALPGGVTARRTGSGNCARLLLATVDLAEPTPTEQSRLQRSEE